MVPNSVVLFSLLWLCSLATAHDAPRTRSLPYSARAAQISFDDPKFASPPRPARPTGAGAASVPCGESRVVAVGDFGVIESPGYPHAYPSGLDCEWRLSSSDPDAQIQATLFDAQTQNNFIADISDSLYMSLTGNWNESLRYSGDFNPVNPLLLLSEGATLGLRFKSSRFSTGARGFKLAWFATTRKKPSYSEPANDVTSAVVCPSVGVGTPPIFPACGQSRSEAPLAAPDASLEDDVLDPINRTNPHPFLVALILDDTQFCSGTLVGLRHVVTSAHCTREVRSFELIFGTSDLGAGANDAGVQRQRADASDVISHPYFDGKSGANDISVIKLRENVTITRYVWPATVPSFQAIALSLTDFSAEMVGWGDTEKGTVYSQSGESSALILPNTFCRALNRGSSGLTMCTRANGASEPSGVCQGDAGSPIFTRSSNCANPQSCNPQSTGSGKPGRPGRPKPQRPKPVKPGKPSRPRPGKPGKPSRPSKPGKPSRPSRPSRPGNLPIREEEGAEDEEEEAEEEDYEDFDLATPVLLGVVSHGSCSRGFSITRLTAYFDFLEKAARF